MEEERNVYKQMSPESCVRCEVNMSAAEHASLSDESGEKSTESSTTDTPSNTQKIPQALLDKWNTAITSHELAQTSIEHSPNIKNILAAWKKSAESPEQSSKCEHRCPRGTNGRTPGTSAYGQMIQNDNNKKEKVCRCMNVTEGDTETYVDCKTKLFFCSLYCPFTNFEQYANYNNGKPISPGWKNPMIFHGSEGVGDLKIVICDHIKGNWHHFWEAVYLHSEGKDSSVTSLPAEVKSSFLNNFRCVLDLAIFHAMLNYHVDEENVPVDCEINKFITQNGKKFTNAMKFLQTDKCTWLPGNLTYDQLMKIQNKNLEICTSTYKFGVTVRGKVKKEVQAQITAMYTEPLDFDEKTQGVRRRSSSNKVKKIESTATTATPQTSGVPPSLDSSCAGKSTSSCELPASGAVTKSIVSLPETDPIKKMESRLNKIEEERKKSLDYVMKIQLASQRLLLESQRMSLEYAKALKVHNDMIPTWESRSQPLLDELKSLQSSQQNRMDEGASEESVQDSIPSAENPEIGVLQDTEQQASNEIASNSTPSASNSTPSASNSTPSASNSTPSASNSTPSVDNDAARVREDTDENLFKRPRLSVQQDAGASEKRSHADSLTSLLMSSRMKPSANVQEHEMSDSDPAVSDAANVLLSFIK